MNPAQTIVQVLDRHLTQRPEAVVFGAAALLLDKDFATRMPERKTNDIDIIIPSHRELQVDADRGFWRALESTNRELKQQGLYITHIFAERQVAPTPEWKQHTVALPQDGLAKLSLQRPRVLDLAVSKMGRGDAQDVEDGRTMLRLHREIAGVAITSTQVMEAARGRTSPPTTGRFFRAHASGLPPPCVKRKGFRFRPTVPARRGQAPPFAMDFEPASELPFGWLYAV